MPDERQRDGGLRPQTTPRAPALASPHDHSPAMKTISIVTPFYNERAAITQYEQAVLDLMRRMPDYRFEVVCVDDGSSDDTLDRLLEIAGRDPRYIVVELSNNFGKESALTAGIDVASGDGVVPLDADLQDPPEVIIDLAAAWEKGADVVLAQRADRSSDTTIKRETAKWFYKVHNRLSRTKIPENVGDFRLIDRQVVEAIKLLPERQRFMKGLFAWVGFKSVTVPYVRQPRSGGETKFSFWRLWNLALEGLTGFSTAPLRLWTYIGTFCAFLSFCFALFIVLRVLLFGIDTPGYASIVVVVVFFGGLQLITIGVIGEYIGRIYMETKQRPSYIVRRLHRND